MVFQAEDRTRSKRHHADVAIQMALQGQWEQAVDLNRSILESFPADVDACNRLGKALTELGRFADARDSYMKAIESDPLNLIARKNLSRLATLGKTAPKKKSKKAIWILVGVGGAAALALALSNDSDNNPSPSTP